MNYSNIVPVGTATKINILIYDIFNDYQQCITNGGGTYGYFYALDFYNDVTFELIKGI